MNEVVASVLAERASSTGLPSARLTAGVPILWTTAAGTYSGGPSDVPKLT